MLKVIFLNWQNLFSTYECAVQTVFSDLLKNIVSCRSGLVLKFRNRPICHYLKTMISDFRRAVPEKGSRECRKFIGRSREQDTQRYTCAGNQHMLTYHKNLPTLLRDVK